MLGSGSKPLKKVERWLAFLSTNCPILGSNSTGILIAATLGKQESEMLLFAPLKNGNSENRTRQTAGRSGPCFPGIAVILLGISAIWSPNQLWGYFQDSTETNSGSSNSQAWRPSFGSGNQGGNGINEGQSPPAMPSRLASSGDLPSQPTASSQAGGFPASVSGQSPAPSERLSIPQDTAAEAPQSGIARVSQSMEQLPNSAGQVWREYDITPYTSKITNAPNPQQAIVDWILKETGTDLWFHHPMGILNATPYQLYVYHTPEIQKVISQLVDRFVKSQGQVQKIDLALMTLENPNWRTTAYRMMQSIPTQTPGVEAWLISKENAAMLQGQLSRRIDVKLLNSGSIYAHEGQLSELRNQKPTQFVGGLQWFENQIPRYQPQLSTVNEGYQISISCLSGLNGSTTEAIIKCDFDQIDRLTNVKLDVPGINGTTEQANIQIPRITSWRLQERFRWSSDQVLLLSRSVGSNVEPDQGGNRLNLPLINNTLRNRRADVLLFIDVKGATAPVGNPTANSSMVPIR